MLFFVVSSGDGKGMLREGEEEVKIVGSNYVILVFLDLFKFGRNRIYL